MVIMTRIQTEADGLQSEGSREMGSLKTHAGEGGGDGEEGRKEGREENPAHRPLDRAGRREERPNKQGREGRGRRVRGKMSVTAFSKAFTGSWY